ncbi:hypothetical protein ACSBR1_032252 [Camellia fascicularis]
MLALTMSITLTMLITLCWSSRAQFLPIDTVVARDGTRNFTRVTDVILVAPNFSARQFYIWVKEGLYRENVIVGENKTNLALFGDGMDKNNNIR